MSEQTPSATFGRSALLVHMHALVPSAEIEPLVAQLLATLGQSDPAAVAPLMAIPMNRQTFLNLGFWCRRVEGNPQRDRLGRAAAKFWAAQTLVATVLRPTILDLTYIYPPAIAPALEQAAQGLFDVGQSQFDCLAMLGLEIIPWLVEKKPKSVAFIEFPIGNTVPTQFLKKLAERAGLSVDIVQWNVPRNDRPKRGRTVEDAAALCAAETGEFDYVALVDEFLTGTRFLKLYEALIGPVGQNRLLPIAMLFPDVTRPDLEHHENRARLMNMLERHAQHIGYTECHVTFPGQRGFRVHAGDIVFWQAPVIWGDSELVAGKRKVNLAFMLIDHLRDIIADLAKPQSVYRPHLESAWAVNERGEAFAFAPGLIQRCFQDAIGDLPLSEFRDRLWARARERFPDDYIGNLSGMSRTGVEDRYNWLREAFLEDAKDRLGEQRAGMLYNAADTVFSSSFLALMPKAGRDLDATLYTLPFNETICTLNRSLVQKLLDRVDELNKLRS